MLTKNRVQGAIIVSLAVIVIVSSCEHEPFLLSEDTVNSPVGPVDTDTVAFKINTTSCEEGTVYFNTQILPVFISNCAISGCHDAASAKEGVVLTNYQNIRRKIKPGNLNDSENYKVLITSDKEDLMPRKPGTEQGYSLPADQINLVKTWILQGAKNNFCDECDTTNYAFNSVILPIFELNCATSVACHGAGAKNGEMTTFSQINSYVSADQIQKRAIVYKDMPPASPLSDCDRLLIKNWIDQGALNN